MREIPSAYNSKTTEDKWYNLWESKKFFRAEPDAKRKPYTIVIPPPNITGILHMGHALNNTVQDILIRWRRMQGWNAEWLPGTDHAGIATQNVVEKMLAKEGIKRQDLGREKFIERVWKWREQYGSTIISQLKRLGCSCDWDRTRFTMDEGLSNAVVEVFIRLYEKGLIYRGNYIINWCPRCQTALSDEEAQHKDLNSFLYYVKYPVKGENRHVTVATTRPETMLGDVAVAVNPKDARYDNLIGETLILPLMNREIKVIADEIVDPGFGTGAVKVTPAHDPNDFEMGRRHNLEPVVVMNPDGTMGKNAGDYSGMDRFEAREAILEDLKEMKLLEKVEPHAHSVGHCYRCHTVIEPYLSLQWFVKMKPLAKAGIEAANSGKIKFYPDRWTKVYLDWMENIRDWCISRQIWWGHRIPVYYCGKCQKTSEGKKGISVSRVRPQKCPDCGGRDIVQDEDVLDTWFSSWLWPFSTFGWPEKTKDLAYFYPTSTLVTAQEIIFFWVARMIISGYEFMGDAPFKDIYIHGTVRDEAGAKMSKSLGNIIDPIEIIDEFGADALRFSMISITAAGQDVFLSKEKFQLGRNFANKIWNAARFVITNLSEDVDTDLCVLYKTADLTLADRWILSNFYSTLEGLDKALESYRFSEAANLLYDFIWHKYCDWYLEIAKSRIKEKNTQIILYKVLEKSLRLLHPIMPFITEEIWNSLPHKRDSIMVQPWPHLQKDLIDKKTEGDMDLAIGIITAIRNIRAEVNIQPHKFCNAIVTAGSGKSRGAMEKSLDYIKNLAKLESLEVAEKLKRPKASSISVFGDCEICVPLDGLVDIEAEKKKVMSKIGELEKYANSIEVKLRNRNFTAKAPKEVVGKEKEKLDEAKVSLDKLKGNLKRLES
ncbi:MAG: valine--tRNA ligase [Omnitrophica WOR_2 bacterium RIFCSPLOWO2_12_FULL_51_24]|nr:MAG: valine--tRNA ligase [Omnitrophica WOR_2 bacterium RIFCSPHIGHO2_01_FULL_49_10]OGX33672.1 MAG: valine--tRNA ligase [Omnitrophica WOR_2 bacterium RIFCSPLOWO2_02_FULL_50_19]OGX41596.1 MAG: valine--tRNA ligase [Omnitrophica WOR_2 bacterium RIFCSPLOWO2_12_FULL_51_24]